MSPCQKQREREISESQSIVLQISFEQPTFQDTSGATWRHSTAARFRGAYWSSAEVAWMKTQWRQPRLIPAMAVRLIDVDCTFHLEKKKRQSFTRRPWSDKKKSFRESIGVDIFWCPCARRGPAPLVWSWMPPWSKRSLCHAALERLDGSCWWQRTS